MNKPPRISILGALKALLVAENQGDIIEEVLIICDSLGIDRPVCINDDTGEWKFKFNN